MPRKYSMGSAIRWVRTHKRIIAKCLAIATPVLAAAWAVVNLIYPSQIEPLMEPGKLNISVESKEVGRNDRYIAEQIVFEVRNVGNNRIYVPSTSYLVRAFKVGPYKPASDGKASTASKEAHQRVQAEVNDYLKSLSPSERETLRAKASDFLFDRQWRDAVKADNFSDDHEYRGMFELPTESQVYIALGRMTGIGSFIEPGEVVKSQVVVLIPSGYEVLIVECRAISSKRKIDDVVFIAAPTIDGLKILAFERSPDLKSRLADLDKAISEALKNGTYDQPSRELGESTFVSSQRSEVYIGEHEAIGIETAKSNTNGND